MDSQADLSLRWALSHLVCFVMSRLKCCAIDSSPELKAHTHRSAYIIGRHPLSVINIFRVGHVRENKKYSIFGPLSFNI